jgi:hypothetical protein
MMKFTILERLGQGITLAAFLCFTLVACSDASDVLGDEDGAIKSDVLNLDATTPLGDVTIDPLDGAVPLDIAPPEDDANPGDADGVNDANDDACPGEAWCPCSDNEECFSGWCVDGPDGTECTKVCDADCPDGYSCHPVTNATGDPTYICLYDHVYYCSPCETGADCAPGLVDPSPHYCVEWESGDGSFCATACETSDDCPEGGACVEIEVGDTQRTVCRPIEGECTCSANAIAVTASTACSVTNELGTCEGARSCDLTGLSACDATAAAPETCDGADEDCDEVIDEDFVSLGEACDGEDADQCEDGTLTCSEGSLGCVDESDDHVEVCNGEDDDCDGTVDESFANVGLPCDGEDLDSCLDGAWVCNNGGEVCDDDGSSVSELCNGIDDDCDGFIDETFADLGTFCDGGDTDLCTDGKWVCGADGGVACDDSDDDSFVETCNDIDDDCDGEVDEGYPDKGLACDGGDNDQCQEGVWQCGADGLICTDNSSDNAEVCNGQDDDCDGQVDEGYDLKGQPCDGADSDLCAEGLWTCNGTDLVCSDTTGPNAEVCNNQDDDCDGDVDEDLVQACETDCGGGVETCISGLWKGCTAMQPKTCTNYDVCASEDMCVSQCPSAPTEVCNESDDNCDGSIDEGFYGDTSNGGVDFPNSWSVNIPQKGTYPTNTAGQVLGHLLSFGDRDWFTIQATEDNSDFCVSGGSDKDVLAQVTVTSPGPALWYEVCACWSDGPAFCGKDDESSPTCVTSQGGNTAVLEVHMDMTCGSTDTGWLDIEVRPANNSLDWDCDDYTVTWAISE